MTPSLPATSDSPASAAAADVAQLVLPEAEWQARRAAHEQRVAPWIAPRLQRTSRSESHPIEDFLFEYYSYRPGQLLRWHPGVDIALEGPAAEELLAHPLYRRGPDGTVAMSVAALKPQRLQFVRWLLTLLEAVRERPPFFGCAGLHEWAMVHRAEEVRHPRWPLRLGRAGTDAVVESIPIRCSHHDAFRFFTPSARPLNRLQPARTDAVRFEQSGCLHANMDLYKWAYKLAPLTSSELVADAFALAREIREVDMRASPYDFSALDLEPIAIETEKGRAEYETHQAEFSGKAAPIRSRLIELCHRTLTAANLEENA